MTTTFDDAHGGTPVSISDGDGQTRSGAAVARRACVASIHVLTRRKLERFKKRLEEERAAVEARITDRAELIRERVRAPDELVDVADAATMLAERDQALIENDLDHDTLMKIERALERVDQGTYGLSEVSGEPIPRERLEAVPWATTLVDERLPDRD